MAKTAEFEPKLPPPMEWEIFFDELGVSAEFLDFRNVITAYSCGFEPGIYINTSPVKPEDATNEVFLEKLVNKVLDEALSKVFGWEKNGEDEFPPNVFPDWIDYNDSTGVISLKLKEETDELFSSGPSKNKLPL